MEKIDFKNKKIFVIGGYGLIGNAVANLLDYNGAKVFILDKNKLRTNNFKFCKFKVSNKLSSIENNLEKIFKTHGIPNGVINCSYPTNKFWNKSSFKNIKHDNFDENIDLHLKSYTWIAKIFAQKMKLKRIKGKIVQLTSIYGVLGQDLSIYKNTKMDENITYPLIKGGISSFTKQLASYFGPYQISINNLCPGGVLEDRKNKKKQEKNFLTNYKNKVPFKRMAKKEEIAKVAVFLLSNYSDYITGQDIIVDGGWSII